VRWTTPPPTCWCAPVREWRRRRRSWLIASTPRRPDCCSHVSAECSTLLVLLNVFHCHQNRPNLGCWGYPHKCSPLPNMTRKINCAQRKKGLEHLSQAVKPLKRCVEEPQPNLGPKRGVWSFNCAPLVVEFDATTSCHAESMVTDQSKSPIVSRMNNTRRWSVQHA
jgi:hypothetical protein